MEKQGVVSAANTKLAAEACASTPDRMFRKDRAGLDKAASLISDKDHGDHSKHKSGKVQDTGQ